MLQKCQIMIWRRVYFRSYCNIDERETFTFDPARSCIQTIISDCSTWISESYIVDKLLKGEYSGPTRVNEEMEIEEDQEEEMEIENQVLSESEESSTNENLENAGGADPMENAGNTPYNPVSSTEGSTLSAVYQATKRKNNYLSLVRPGIIKKNNARITPGGIVERAVVKNNDCIDVLLQFSVYTDSIVCFTLGKVKQLFVMNLVVENSRERDRQSRAMSHFVTIIRDKDSISEVVGIYMKVNQVLGKYGIYVMHNGRCLHIRWAFNGIHGDTVAQESMEDFTNQKFSKYPAVLDSSCHSLRFSWLEGLLVHMTGTCYTLWDKYCTVIGRSFDAMHSESGYRMAPVVAANPTFCGMLHTINDITSIEMKDLLTLFNLFPKDSWHLWLPLVLPSGQEWHNRMDHLISSLIVLFKVNDKIDPKILLEKIKKGSSTDVVMEESGVPVTTSHLMECEEMLHTAERELQQAIQELKDIERRFDGDSGWNWNCDDSCEEEDTENLNAHVDSPGMDKEIISESSGMLEREVEYNTVAREIATAFMGEGDKRIRKKKVVNLDESTYLQRFGRELLDAMHHIPNFTVLILRFLQGDMIPSMKSSGFPAFFQAYWKCLRCPEDPENPDLDFDMMGVPPRVNALAMERIQELRDEGAPSWLTEQIIIPSFYMQLRDEECIKFSLCYFSVVYRDSMDVPFVFCAKNALECIGYLYNTTSNLNEAASIQSILNIFVSLIQSMTYPKFGNVSLLNSQFYWMGLAFYGDMKLGDCFQNESALRLVKGACNNNPDVVKTVCKRMQLYEICDGIIRNTDKPVYVSYSPCSNSEDLLNLAGDMECAFICNYCDDFGFWKDNSVGRITYLDTLMELPQGQKYEYPQMPDGFTFAKWDRKVFKTIKVNASNYHSAEYPAIIDNNWIYKNRHVLAVTRCMDGNIYFYIVCGYVMRTLNDQQYPLALCQMIPTHSGSSLLSTHYRFIKTSNITRKLIPISLTRLQMFRCKLYRLDDVEYLFLSPESICIRQTTRDRRDDLYKINRNVTRISP